MKKQIVFNPVSEGLHRDYGEFCDNSDLNGAQAGRKILKLIVQYGNVDEVVKVLEKGLKKK